LTLALDKCQSFLPGPFLQEFRKESSKKENFIQVYDLVQNMAIWKQCYDLSQKQIAQVEKEKSDQIQDINYANSEIDRYIHELDHKDDEIAKLKRRCKVYNTELLELRNRNQILQRVKSDIARLFFLIIIMFATVYVTYFIDINKLLWPISIYINRIFFK
jgi:oligoendopeptidase F